MTNAPRPIQFLVSPGKRLVLLFLLMICGLFATVLLTAILSGLIPPEKARAAARISTVIQDVLMLIAPAIITAVLVTRLPARLLAIDRGPGLLPSVLAVVVLIIASPFMSVIIEWNASVHLPESMSGIEQSLRAMEDRAGNAVLFMLGDHSVANLIMNLLIVAVLAGVSEELFFRGALQRLLGTTALSPTAAVWIAAILFSAVHFQFFGFVPRMLLGVYFGYLLLWSRSVWLPVIAHTANNAMYVVLQYTTGNGEPDLGQSGSGAAAIVASVLLTAAGLWYIRRLLTNTEE